ncbi:MAG: nicotinate-nicotinamide nucleotide adenylyltransferase [Anaerolineae bacterium]|nr:nicotinate-nicotinamide nucleotide adenylyltransferase [Anaerolineae bacterium]
MHQGHIDLLVGVLDNLRKMGYPISQTLILPVYRRNPTGAPKDQLPQTFEQRVAMCELAIREVRLEHPDHPIAVSRIEATLAMRGTSPNYTSETLSYLNKHDLAGMKLMFVISSQLLHGMDPEFSHWYHIETILRQATLVVCPRPGFPINQEYIQSLNNLGGHIVVLSDVKTLDISSTIIRQRLARGEHPLALAHEGVIPLSIAHYLAEHNLYMDPSCSQKHPFQH